MDILDALEQKVNKLLDETASLRVQNAQLKETLALKENNGSAQLDCSLYENRIAELEKLLAQEASLRKTMMDRIDSMVLNLEDKVSK